MNEMDRWIYLDGPEPADLRPLFDALREPVAAPPADPARMSRALFARIASMRAGVAKPSAAVEAAPSAPLPPAEAPARWTALRPEATNETSEGSETSERNETSDAEEAQPTIHAAQPALQAAQPTIEEAPVPSVKRGPARLLSTAPALDVPPEVWKARAALPFTEPEPPPDPNDKSRARTEKVRVMPTPTGTVGIDDNSISHAMANGPFKGGGTLGMGIVPIPTFTPAQYASFCMELLFAPAHEAQVLDKYKVVSQASHRALHEHWRERFASKTEELAEFEEARVHYWRWLEAMRRWEAAR